MTLHQLRIFECVAKHLNITKESAAFHISQPSMSQQLKLLEEEFARKFFIRVSQGQKSGSSKSRGQVFTLDVGRLLAQ